VLETAGVFPIVVLEFEAVAAVGVVLAFAEAVILTAVKAALASIVVPIVGVIVAVAPGLGRSHRAEGEGNGCTQHRHSKPVHHTLSQHNYLQIPQTRKGQFSSCMKSDAGPGLR
jgi:hypothetical protein